MDPATAVTKPAPSHKVAEHALEPGGGQAAHAAPRAGGSPLQLCEEHHHQPSQPLLGSGAHEIGSQARHRAGGLKGSKGGGVANCLLYTSDAADDLLCVDLGGRRIIKKKNNK
eukprot:TRINITY_DN11066_c0_g1_i1.p1 TRINITY_DN11066_c0_g1~~TRINITY_DN11066_c0_g1_i1.p1  ORF type:complete len:113 (-),score=37.75 TRINITY_DN11066_c0_g1_i1:108-446(-)